MDLVKLTGAQHQFFDDNGYLVVPDVLSTEMIDKLTQVSDRLIESFDANGAYVQRRPGIVQEPDFHPLLTQSPTVPLVAQLLSPNIQLHTTAIIYKFPEPADEEVVNQRGWHRDSGLAVDLRHKNVPRVSIKVGYCLTDFKQSHSGFTLFASGSHLIDTPLPIPKGEVDPVGTIELCLNAGDAFLFENRIFHTSAPNLTDRVSKVIIFGYAYRWMGGSHKAMSLVQPDDAVLAQVDDVAKQLLGATSDGLIDWAKQHDVFPEPTPWVMEI